MIVVSDTTPINYLVLIGEIVLLKQLFERVIIPQAVFNELQHEQTPPEVKDWVYHHPDWLEVRQADPAFFKPRIRLGVGEQEAIALALELNAEAVLLDDRDAVKETRRQGITVLTTLNLFEQAAGKGMVDLDTVLDKLSHTNFRFPPEEVIEAFRERDRQRKLSGQ